LLVVASVSPSWTDRYPPRSSKTTIYLCRALKLGLCRSLNQSGL
jgi:hypothetical protein